MPCAAMAHFTKFLSRIRFYLCHFRQVYTKNKNENQGQVFIVTKDANFSHIFVPHHVFNFIHNNAGEFTLLFS